MLNRLYSGMNDESLKTLSDFLFSFSMNIRVYKRLRLPSQIPES